MLRFRSITAPQILCRAGLWEGSWSLGAGVFISVLMSSWLNVLLLSGEAYVGRRLLGYDMEKCSNSQFLLSAS